MSTGSAGRQSQRPGSAGVGESRDEAHPRAVTFDLGQTLVELDHELLARRIAERGGRVEKRVLERETPASWQAYNEAKRSGMEGREAWLGFMVTLLSRSGLPGDQCRELAEWLWTEQPKHNLWRKPIPGMLEIADTLERAGVPVGVVSNSEGRIAELFEELGWSGRFRCIADSGRLGFEKPDARIFEWAAGRLGVAPDELVHVGDSWEADVRGALGVGARVIWFPADEARELPPRVAACRTPDEVRGALAAFGVPLGGGE